MICSVASARSQVPEEALQRAPAWSMFSFQLPSNYTRELPYEPANRRKRTTILSSLQLCRQPPKCPTVHDLMPMRLFSPATPRMPRPGLQVDFLDAARRNRKDPTGTPSSVTHIWAWVAQGVRTNRPNWLAEVPPPKAKIWHLTQKALHYKTH